MVKNLLLNLKTARKQVRMLLADSFEKNLLEQHEKLLKKKEQEKAQRKEEKQTEKEFFPRPKKKVEDRTIQEHADETHKQLDKQFEREKWKEVLKKKIIFLEEGRDDVQITEIGHMLMSILNQPGDTVEVRREKQFAKSILGGSEILWMTGKTASFADELEKAKKIQEREEAKRKEPGVITKKDYTDEELRDLGDEMSSRLDEKKKKQYSPYIGWKHEGSDGKVTYKLSGAQLDVILNIYEKVLQRRLQPQRDKTDKRESKPLPKFLEKKVKETAPLSDALSDDDLAGLDLEGFGKISAVYKAKQFIKEAQEKMPGKK